MINYSKFSRILFSFSGLLILFLSGTGLAQSYLWPTNASQLMSSNFCEFRPRHYHAAIDIKTWNRTGYKAFAIEDGYVVRVRVSAFGYGRAVYLKLKDGNIAVYAHLNRFWPQLETYVNQIRRERKKYRMDLHLKPGQFPVKKGQVVGYTGKTGIGVPHLHFEIRNSRNKPINPLPFYRETIQDNISPTLYQAALIPMDSKSLINLSSDTLRLDLGVTSSVDISDTLFLSGRIGLALKVYDRANGARNLFNFYRAKMWIDDSLVYTIQYDSFSYAQTELMELDKNFSLWRKREGIFHNFFRHPENKLPHYRNTPVGGGVIDSETLEEGLHHLRLEIEDFWRNKARFDMSFISGHPPALSYDLNRWLDDELFLRIQSRDTLATIKIFRQGNPHGYSHSLPSNSLGNTVYDGVHYYAIAVPVSASDKHSWLKLQGFKKNGIPSLPLFLSPAQVDSLTGVPAIQLQHKRLKKNRMELVVGIHHSNPEALLSDLYKEFPQLYWFPVEKQKYQIHVPVEIYSANKDRINQTFGLTPENTVTVNPSKQHQIYSPDSLFKAHFPSQALYEETLISLRHKATFSTTLPVEPPYRKYGDIYDLQPFDQPVNEGVWVTLTAPDSLSDANGLGLYYWDAKKGWLFIPSGGNSNRNSFTARVTSLEKFTLIQDTIPPEIIPAQKIKNGVLQSRNGYLSFVLKDDMCGIHKESQIQVYVNNRWHLFEYDPEEDFIAFQISTSSFIKPAKVRIKAKDNVGNTNVKEFLAH